MSWHIRRGMWTGLAAGSIFGLLARFLADNRILTGVLIVMTLTFMFVVPLVLGYLTVRPHPEPSKLYCIFMPWIPMCLTVAVAAAMGWEGSICIVMGLPLLLILSSVGGWAGGVDRLRSARVTAVALCLPFILTPLEQQLPLPQAPRRVDTSILIAAPPAAVWREIVEVPPIRPEERRPALFTTLGFPAPISATLDRPGIGGVRQARFEGGVLFVETVTVWKEGEELAFSIAAQTDAIPPSTLDPHVIIGGPYFDALDGSYRIEALGGERVRLHLRSHTRVSTHFNLYAGPWSDAIMRSIQRNILEVIRSRAENGAQG